MEGDGLFGAPRTVSVLLPIPSDRPYSYAVPDDMILSPGDIVQVPLGPRKIASVVWDDDETAARDFDPKKLRPVEQKFDCPPISADMRRFVDWVAHYTLSPPGMVARMLLRAPAALDPEKPLKGLRYTGGDVERVTSARSKVLELAEVGMAWTRSGLAHADVGCDCR